jgi:hypothetical protein
MLIEHGRRYGLQNNAAIEMNSIQKSYGAQKTIAGIVSHH